MQVFQSTLKKVIFLEGYGVHSGQKASVTLHPAPVNHGIVFMRLGHDGEPVLFPATVAYSVPADLCTVLTAAKSDVSAREAGENGAHTVTESSRAALRIETIEHLMAALSACGLDNLLIEVSGHEVPILDGCSAVYMQAILEAGIEQQQEKRRYLRVLRPIRVQAEKGGGFAEFLPAEKQAEAVSTAMAAHCAAPAPEEPGQCYDVEIVFTAAAVGRQRLEFMLTQCFFADSLAQARTFGFLADAEKLRAMGLAQGANAENSVIIDKEGQVLNPQALSAPDAFVRHKALDAVGDTALLGKPFIGLFRSFKSGHKLNAAAVRALLSDSRHYETIEF